MTLHVNALINSCFYLPGPAVKVIVKEDSDAILPCSLSSREDIQSKLFDWKKDGRKEVFMYDNNQYGEHHSGQDAQFKGRVSHFPDELKNGNASIKITKTKVADSGNYACIFPRLQPERKFHIELVVGECFHETVIKTPARLQTRLVQVSQMGSSPVDIK